MTYTVILTANGETQQVAELTPKNIKLISDFINQLGEEE